MNKTPRQSEGRCVARVLQSVATNLYTFRNERSDELGGMAVNRFKDEYGSEWLETVAMTPQGIQSYLEEKEIVCCG